MRRKVISKCCKVPKIKDASGESICPCCGLINDNTVKQEDFER